MLGCQKRQPNARQIPQSGNDEPRTGGDKADQPEKVLFMTLEHVIEAFIHLLKTLVHQIEALAHQLPLMLELFLYPHHPLAQFDFVDHRRPALLRYRKVQNRNCLIRGVMTRQHLASGCAGYPERPRLEPQTIDFKCRIFAL
jgi:hypothetical protein